MLCENALRTAREEDTISRARNVQEQSMQINGGGVGLAVLGPPEAVPASCSDKCDNANEGINEGGNS